VGASECAENMEDTEWKKRISFPVGGTCARLNPRKSFRKVEVGGRSEGDTARGEVVDPRWIWLVIPTYGGGPVARVVGGNLGTLGSAIGGGGILCLRVGFWGGA